MRGQGSAACPHKPAPWASDVQGIVRSARLPKRGPGAFSRLCLSDDGALEAVLIGAARAERDQFDFAIVALARDLRALRSGIGDEMLADFDQYCRVHAGSRTVLELAAAVHVENSPAKAMFARNGWAEGDALAGDARYRRWGKDLEV